MAKYEDGAFEALQWAWMILKDREENPKSLENARKEIREKLKSLSEGHEINFHNYVESIIPQ